MKANTAVPPPLSARQRRVDVLGVAASVFVFGILAAFQAYVIPVYNPPDEASHVGYMLEVSHGRLPTIDTEIPPDGFPRELYDIRDDAHRDIWVANHPPLFYLATALPARLGTRTMPYLAGIRLVRVLPIAFGALSVLLIAALAARLVPGRPQVMVAAAALTAASPAFSHFSGILYNDSLGVLTSTATLLAAVDLVRRGPSRGRLALLAAAAALAALSRSSGLIVMGIAGLAAIVGALIHSGEASISRRVLRGIGMAALVGIAVAVTSGWFYLRNVRLYGDPTGAAALFEKFDRVPNGSSLSLLASPRIWGLAAQRLVDYSYFNLSDVRRLEDSETVWSRLVLLIPVFGMLVILLRRARYRLIPSLRSPRLVAWGLCLLFLVLLGWSVVSFASGGGNVHGRYLFPGLGVLATGAALGLGALPFGRRGVLVVAVVVAMHVLGYMVAQQYLEAAAIQVPGQTPLETALIAIKAPPAWLLLSLLSLALGVLTAIQAVALWRLAPPATGYVLLPSRRPRMGDPALEPPAAGLNGPPVPGPAAATDAETASISATSGT